MMPNRILKESICTSETFEGLSDFEENFFYKIIVNCDDYGRFDARIAILKSRCYPLRERLTLKTIADALSSLARAGCVKLYDVDGRPYLYLPTWEVHQQVRAKKSKYPEPDSNGLQMISDDCICPRNPIQSESESNPKHAPARATATPLEKGMTAVNARSFSPPMAACIAEWLTYKTERRDKYTDTGISKLLTTFERNAAEYGEDAVIYAVDQTIANGWQGIVWDKAQTAPRGQAQSREYVSCDDEEV